MFNYICKRETLLVAGLTVALYASVYFYERGAASELNIPLDLITISITTISDDLISFYIFLLPMLTISSALLIWSKKDKLKKSASFLAICVVYVFLMYSMGATSKEKIILSVFYSLILLHLLSQWMPIESKSENPTNDKAKHFGLQVMNYGALLFFFAFTFVTLGRESVYKKQFNTFLSSDQEFAIVKIYGENVFAWSVDNGNLVHELTYFRMENINGAKLKSIKEKSDKK